MKKILQARILCVIGVLALIFLMPSRLDAQPPNNLCSAPISIVSIPASACGPTTAGTLVASTYTAFAGACGASGGNRNDIWYSFVARSTNPTVRITATFAQPSIQVLSGTCGPATMTSVGCATSATTLSLAGLTLGTTYLIRIWSDNNSTGTMTICVTDPYDVCASAVTLTSSPILTTAPGCIFGASTSATSFTTTTFANCMPAGIQRDVWYKFVAQTTNPTITLSNIGVGFTNPGMQLLSNNCGGNFTSYYCGTVSGSNIVINSNYLTPGTTYFIRVFSTTV